jgi:hypothetical protein
MADTHSDDQRSNHRVHRAIGWNLKHTLFSMRVFVYEGPVVSCYIAASLV